MTLALSFTADPTILTLILTIFFTFITAVKIVYALAFVTVGMVDADTTVLAFYIFAEIFLCFAVFTFKV